MTTSVESLCYVFGIVEAGASAPPPADTGLASQLRLVEGDGVAAVVGTLPDDRPLGKAADLLAHDRVLADLVAAGTPVLPMRFGAVMTDEAAVVEELLGGHREDFLAELESIRGRVQYTVTLRYEQDVVLRELLSEHPEIAQLRTAGDTDGAGSFDRRLRLGELVVRALEQRRPAQAPTLLEEIGSVADVRVHQSTSPEVVLTAALLIDSSRAADFERRLEEMGKRHHGRLRIRLVGPSPAYDFVRSA